MIIQVSLDSKQRYKKDVRNQNIDKIQIIVKY